MNEETKSGVNKGQVDETLRYLRGEKKKAEREFKRSLRRIERDIEEVEKLRKELFGD